MKKINRFFLLLILVYAAALCFSCKNENKKLYRVYVQLNNKCDENYKVQIFYNGKDINNELPLKAGFVLNSLLGNHSIIDSDFGTFIKSLKIELLNDNDEIALKQEFSFSDGFIVKIDDRGIPARYQQNEITLFLDVKKDSLRSTYEKKAWHFCKCKILNMYF